MANEATITLALQFAKGGLPAQTFSSGNVSRDVAGTSGYIRNVQNVGTAAEAVLLGDVAATGALCMVHNLDATNYVEVLDSTGGTACIRIGPGDYQLFRFTTAAPAFKANTAACLVEYLLVVA